MQLALSYGAIGHSTAGHNMFYCSAVTLAASFKRLDIVPMLLGDFGRYTVDSPGDCHLAPLQVAAVPSRELMIALLLSHGTDVIRKQGWMQPLVMVALQATAGVPGLLVGSGAELGAIYVGQTAMEVAMHGENMEVANVLVIAGAAIIAEEWGRKIPE